MLNEQDTLYYLRLAKQGDNGAKETLLEHNTSLLKSILKRYLNKGVEYDDLLQVASEALILGVEKFDPDIGVQFSTYITPTVTGIIKNYFRDYSRAVRPPRRVYTLSAKIRHETNEHFKEYGVKPTVKQLSKKLGVSEEEIIEALEYRAPVSLDSKIVSEDGEGRLYDVIPDTSDRFEAFEDNEALRSEISKLDATEQKVVLLRFVQGKSQSEVGRILGVSQMFVSRAERKIVDKLRESLL